MDKKVLIERGGKPFLEKPSRIEYYTGSENSIKYLVTKKATFTCNFKGIIDYPFGYENCSFFIFISGSNNKKTTLIHPKPLDYKGSLTVGEYEINGWDIRESFRSISGLEVSVTLKSELLGILLVTYVPTIMMNIINQVGVLLTKAFDTLFLYRPQFM